MGTRRILRFGSDPVNAFSQLLNQLLQNSPTRCFLQHNGICYARQRQLPPFFCTISRRDSWAAISSSLAKITRRRLA
ncbi:hypothetical protein F153LOC_07090 [Lelliottia sp. F153]|nr:hypothetical protein DAI21_00155 [Lelliottia sp. WB101]PLY46811.1 hypothetical protein F159LOC_07900 [Lelliottia sp. F159]PLY51072.1 hypothetical protein F154LOC_10500 [Lelliottia sp. F154]PLY56734.1 hypothetical protein F153LOC_07090 [Lelliottia sp. F153]UQC70082.1 hypothetical protein C0560_04485 [Lelliottia sp. AC1]